MNQHAIFLNLEIKTCLQLLPEPQAESDMNWP
jgi:hypothetical protein